MTEKGLLKKWFDKEIENYGGYTSPEYIDFQKNYRSVLVNIGKKIDFKLHSFSKSHYSFSAVMQSNITSQFYYISISDVRFFTNEWANHILYRTMKHEHDWTGGINRFCSLETLSKNLSILDKKFFKNLEKENTRQVVNSIEPLKSNTEDFDVKYA